MFFAIDLSLENIEKTKKCAFCKHWYDPSNSAIKPRNPRFNQWEFDDQRRKMCMKKNLEMNANAFCGWYECKIDLQ